MESRSEAFTERRPYCDKGVVQAANRWTKALDVS